MNIQYSKLLAGYQKFKDTYFSKNRAHLAQLEEAGQRPSAMVIACSDSRVDPALLLQADLGDLFVVRNVANIVPRYNPEIFQSTAAALKFGIQNLAIPHLIILGHSSCAGITSLIEQTDDQADSITRWVAQLAAVRAPGKSINEYAKEALHISKEHCMTYPWIVEKLKNNEVIIHLWYFSLSEGTLFSYCSEKKTFNPL